jgi:ABC-type phosphate transport system substrate-binding protein
MAEQRISINALIQPDDGALLDAVAAEPQAIGYSMMASATATDLNLLSIEGIAPTTSETASQTYPLTVPLYFVALAEPEGELRAFLAWLQSGNGQMVLGEKYGRVR